MTRTLHSGTMPYSKGTYEQFEGLLASYCLTYYHFKDSTLKRKQNQYEKLLKILNELAEKHGVQLPEEAIENPRCVDPKWAPHIMAYKTMIEKIFDFYRIFCIDRKGENENDLIKLHGVLNESIMVF